MRLSRTQASTVVLHEVGLVGALGENPFIRRVFLSGPLEHASDYEWVLFRLGYLPNLRTASVFLFPVPGERLPSREEVDVALSVLRRRLDSIECNIQP